MAKNKLLWLPFFAILIWLFVQCSGSNQKNQIAVLHPNFAEHIWPIIYKNCVPCHRTNGGAPFKLTNYDEVKRKAKTIAKVTRLRLMPPWPANPDYTHFKDEKFLSQAEIDMIQNWVKDNTPAGDLKRIAKVKIPDFRSFLGKPDLTLSLDSVLLEGDFKDRFFIIKIPGEIPTKRYVKAVEFLAGQPKYVHHFNGHLLLYEEGKKKNIFEGEKKVEISNGEYDADFEKLNLYNDDGTRPKRLHSVVNYLPGVLPVSYPNGIGTFELSKQFVFVGNDLHYGPTPKRVMDKSVINLFFTDTAPSRPVGEIMLGTNGVSKIVPPLLIAPGKIATHRTEFRIKEDISVLTINPHLHLIGKSFWAFAVKPNGDTVRLIKIDNWNFRWQFFYTFHKMQVLPKGTLIVAIATFDNTASNPNNPFSPPQAIGERLEYGGASMRATDEMFQFIITYTPYQKGDEEVGL